MVTPALRRKFMLMSSLFVIYFISAHFGLRTSAIHGFAALIWPPSGIALAAMIIFGRQLWPAVFLAAFLVNSITGAPFLTAVGIAVGNTLEGLVAATLCHSRYGFQASLEKLADVIRLIVVATFCTLLSASIGVLSLWLGGVLTSSQFLMAGIQWWAGDALAVMAITPLLLVFSSRQTKPRLSWFNASVWERIAFISVLFGLSWAVLSSFDFVVTLTGFKGIYILVPTLLWGAMRFGQAGAVGVTFTISLLAVWNTAHGIGPFVGQSYIANLLHLFVFVVTISITGMFVGCVVSQRENEKAAAEDANKAKSTFLANMSHEIRTPLGAVIGFSELLSETGLSDKDRASYVEAIKRNGNLLTALINDILDLSKIEAGKIELQISEVNLADLLADIKMSVAKKVTDKHLLLSFQVPDSMPPKIYTDTVRLRQVLINILDNAIKFTSQGSISVGVKSQQLDKEKNKIDFIVHDTGIGLRSEDAKKLFAPFSQVEASTKRHHGGVGLGLVLSRRLANLLGGDVVLKESVVGKGSTFVVSILSEYKKVKHSEIQNKNAPAKGLRLDGRRFLLAEDSLDTQVIIARILNLAGAKVEVVVNGQEALSKAVQGVQFDAILMDLQMPVMDGYEACAELRKTGYDGKIVALTAHALESERQRCLESGFDDHISKPVHSTLLVESLHRLI